MLLMQRKNGYDRFIITYEVKNNVTGTNNTFADIADTVWVYIPVYVRSFTVICYRAICTSINLDSEVI